jgi:hypothetical protein
MRRQSAYTFQANAALGRHGWVRLTPAYSVHLVEALLDAHPNPEHVLDPFCGTGTTALCVAQRGCAATTIDINPFLAWLSRAKLARYTPSHLSEAEEAGRAALALIAKKAVEATAPPPLARIERWWGPDTLEFLCRLRGAIDVVGSNEAVRDLLLVAFCRTLMSLSNAAFNHQSLSFSSKIKNNKFEKSGVFMDNLKFVLRGACENPCVEAHVVCADARRVAAHVREKCDLVITSPPYANRMSYVRELRPYMYWLGFLTDGRAAGDLDWAAIGGTWGCATSRLVRWARSGCCFTNAQLDAALREINREGGRVIISNYIIKYFDDIWEHINDLTNILSSGARVHYIVGNSMFYGVLINVQDILADMLSQLGFTCVAVKPIRRRNSNAVLFEFEVSGRWR